MIRSPLRYPGGKNRHAEKICELVPPFDEFREPFVGGGSVFFRLKQKFPPKKYWINDKYPELTAFWRKMQTDADEVIGQICEWRNEFSDGKTLYKFLRDNKPNFEEVQTAAMFFVFNRITFSGTTEAGGFSAQAFEKRFTDSSIERLKNIPEILSGVKITNSSYEEILTAKGKNVFLFLDPPYFSATNSALYGKNGNLHKSFDHRRFAEDLKNCPHRWLLTYDDSPFIREIFSFADIEGWNPVYGMKNVTKNSSQRGKELFISNYQMKTTADAQRQFSFTR